MKKMMMAGLAVIAGAVLATASMAYPADVDILMIDLQPDNGIHVMARTPDGPDLLMAADLLAEAYVVPDGVASAAITTFQSASLPDRVVALGGVSDLMVDDAMRLWRAQTVDAFTVSPDLLI